MNASHARLTDWALAQLAIRPNAAILDVGCGGGRTISRLATMVPQGHVQGVDYSQTCVDASRAFNRQLVDDGRVRVERASVASLPFSDRTFDLVTAVETHYYWPDLTANLREILRVLKRGGEVALVAETHRGGPLVPLYAIGMWLVRGAYLTAPAHEAALRDAGFAEVSTVIGPNRTWILARGRRP